MPTSTARRDHVSLHLAGSATALSLTIADDGVGFDVEAAMGRGLGLISMGERLDAVGGTLKIRIDTRRRHAARDDRAAPCRFCIAAILGGGNNGCHEPASSAAG